MSTLIFLARLVRIGIGYCVASCAVLGIISIPGGTDTGMSMSDMLSFSWALAILCSIPSVFAVVIFETASVRRWRYHASYGALLGGAFSLPLAASAIVKGFEPFGSGFAAFFAVGGLFALAGMTSATAYWLIAGRYSGKATLGTGDQTVSASA